MCDYGLGEYAAYAAYASAAISAATAVAANEQQRQAANAQSSSIIAGAVANNATIAEREKQINANTADQLSARARQAMIERGRITAAAGESGLGDNTGRNTLESFFNQSTDVAAIQNNNANAEKQAQLQGTGMAAQAKSSLNQIRQPSWVATGLQITGEGLDAYGKVNAVPKSKTVDTNLADTSPGRFGYNPVTGLSNQN